MIIKDRLERGLSQSVQYAIIWPTLMLVTLGIIQAGVWVHGHHVAIRAVNAAADEARGYQGDQGQAEELGTDIAQAGGLTGVSIQVVRGPNEVTATLHGTVPMFFDLGLSAITETATVPTERVTQP